MGCLHEGHLKLVRRAREYGSKVVVSIFVNPLQFGPTDDFERYPRTFLEYTEKLEAEGVDLCFHPDMREMYAPNFCTQITVAGLDKHLCGKFRVGHFQGVATVCQKLFQITQADYSVFGEKDFQQLRILQQMVEDLNLPMRIVPHETVREADGLALSSRNRFLSSEDRALAARVPTALQAVRVFALANPQGAVGEAIQAGLSLFEASLIEVEYLDLASTRDLTPAACNSKIAEIPQPRIFTAVRIGKTRLIDNVSLSET